MSNLRLQRFHRWAVLWLKWFVSFLDAVGALGPISEQVEKAAHGLLDRIERVIVAIVMLRAVRCVRCVRARRPFAVHRLRDAGLSRAVIGSALRRRLRPRQLRQRIEALTQNIDALVTRLLKRLPCGLTRRRPMLTRPDMSVVALVRAGTSPAIAVDSS